jgi:hypothetical protein
MADADENRTIRRYCLPVLECRAAKKDKYFKTSIGSAVFALTTQVLELPSWTPSIIEKRQQELTAMLAKEWELI